MNLASSLLVPVFALGVLSSPSARAQQLPPTAEARFELLDSNGNGTVSRDEYAGDVLFNTLDADDNNRVTADEMQQALGPQRDGQLSAADRIRAADLNTDGELTEEELQRADEARFQQLDTNQDGTLDLAEMKSGFVRP